MTTFALVCPAIFLVALLYSCVGQAGASGYIAVLSLFSFDPRFIKPTALVLNVLVAAIATYQFWRAGYFSWSLFWPFAVLSIPFAFLGGSLVLPVRLFQALVGAVLLTSAFRLFFQREQPDHVKPAPLAVSLPVGAGIGLLSGITATGGGILLTPLLLFFRWATTKHAAAASAMFILTNSLAALLGHLTSRQPLPGTAWPLAIAAILGGIVGSYLGSKYLPARTIHISLAFVLILAGLKLLWISN